tara:strand:- start:119 stop:433 length:315 start_codon:yes stop_codon:yes gene_type:complete
LNSRLITQLSFNSKIKRLLADTNTVKPVTSNALYTTGSCHAEESLIALSKAERVKRAIKLELFSILLRIKNISLIYKSNKKAKLPINQYIFNLFQADLLLFKGY